MKTGSSMRDLDASWPVEQRRERAAIRKGTAMPVTRTRTVVLISASFSLAVMSFAGGVTRAHLVRPERYLLPEVMDRVGRIPTPPVPIPPAPRREAGPPSASPRAHRDPRPRWRRSTSWSHLRGPLPPVDDHASARASAHCLNTRSASATTAGALPKPPPLARLCADARVRNAPRTGFAAAPSWPSRLRRRGGMRPVTLEEPHPSRRPAGRPWR
jgi:hypothetical protein